MTAPDNIQPRERLREARIRHSLSEKTLAQACGISAAEYCDLEADSNNLESIIDLASLETLCRILDLSPAYLFGYAGSHDGRRGFDFPALAAHLRKFLQSHHISLTTFQVQCGENLYNFLDRPRVGERWNLNSLRNICIAMQIPWHTFLN
jgi:transcriptional regulator with XRE-family HTH domain